MPRRDTTTRSSIRNAEKAVRVAHRRWKKASPGHKQVAWFRLRDKRTAALVAEIEARRAQA